MKHDKKAIKYNCIFICLLLFSINSYGQTAKSTAMTSKPPLQFAIINPDIGNPKVVLASFKPLMRWMGSKVKRKIIVRIYSDVDKMVKELKAGNVDLGFTGILEYFKIQEKFPIKPLLTITRHKHPYYTSCFVVTAKNKDKKIKDFKGKRFGYTSFHKAQGGLYPQILLLHNGFSPDLNKFFSSTKAYYSDINGVYDLLRNKIDACSLSESTLNILKSTSPGISRKLIVLYKQEKLMFSPFFYRADLDKKLRNRIIKENLLFIKTIQGRQLLMMFKVDGLKPVKDEDYAADHKFAMELGYIKK